MTSVPAAQGSGQVNAVAVAEHADVAASPPAFDAKTRVVHRVVRPDENRNPASATAAAAPHDAVHAEERKPSPHAADPGPNANPALATAVVVPRVAVHAGEGKPSLHAVDHGRYATPPSAKVEAAPPDADPAAKVGPVSAKALVDHPGAVPVGKKRCRRDDEAPCDGIWGECQLETPSGDPISGYRWNWGGDAAVCSSEYYV